MRIFDIYDFNIAGKAAFNDTKIYIDKMLSELGFGYKNTALQIIPLSSRPVYIEILTEALPILKKYLQYTDVNPKFGKPFFSSYTDNWDSGELYCKPEEAEEAVNAFYNARTAANKISRINFSIYKCYLRFHGTDWYGDGNISPATAPRSKYNKSERPENPEVLCSGIELEDCGSEDFIRLRVTVEATTGGTPRDTSDIIEKLKPYLGEIMQASRKCMPSHEEAERYRELKRKYTKRLNDLFDTTVGTLNDSETQIIQLENGSKMMLHGETIKGICDKHSINAAFGSTDMRITESKGKDHFIKITDKHNYCIEFMFFRKSLGNEFSFCMRIISYNFTLPEHFQKTFKVRLKSQADEKLRLIAEFCEIVRNEITDELAADYGSCPEWFRKPV